MAELKFIDHHNMIAIVSKVRESEGFHEVLDHLFGSYYSYALTTNPKVYVEQVTQFWTNAVVQGSEGNETITSRVHGHTITISESLIRTHLQLDDEAGISSLSNEALFGGLTNMGYEGSTNKFTFYKALFPPQWKFLIHTIQQCLSPKRTAWNEFSSSIAYAIVCLSTSQRFNFSKMIFNGMLSNLDTKASKFLMYPRFIQLLINRELTDIPPSAGVFLPLSHTKKVFSNMRRVGKGFSGAVTPLFSTTVGVTHPQGEGSGLHPTSTGTPTDTQPTPSTSTIPQSPIHSAPIPILKTYKSKKTKRAPSSLESTPQQPESPHVDFNLHENIQWESEIQGAIPSPQKVVHEEQGDHSVRAHTTVDTHRGPQDSMNIVKTQSEATSGEKLPEGPRCQETMGEGAASARQETSFKHSYDSPKVGKPPKGDEDRYTYEELMETCANIAADVASQGTLIKQQDLIIAQQQELLKKQEVEVAKLQKVVFHQYTELQNLKKTVERLMQERMQRQFVMHMSPASVPSQKGENLKVSTATATSEPPTTKPAAETQPKAAAEKPAAAPKAKAKGVVIQEGSSLKKQRVPEVVKGKGKEKMVEPEKPMKKKEQILADAVLARKFLEEEEKQIQIDEELARRMQAEEEAEAEAEKAAAIAKQMRARKAAKRPSPAQVRREERRKMITFLRNSMNVSAQRLQKMSDKTLKNLYVKEKRTLDQGTEKVQEAAVEKEQQAEESEKVQQESEKVQEEEETEKEQGNEAEDNAEKEKVIEEIDEAEIDEAEIDKLRKEAEKAAKEDQKEEDTEMPQQEETVPVKTFKRKKLKAKSGPYSKKLKQSEKAQSQAEQKEQQQQEESSLMIVLFKPEKPVDAVPLQAKSPQIIDWYTIIDDETEKQYYAVIRKDESTFAYPTWSRMIKTISRDDLEDIIRIGQTKYPVLSDITDVGIKLAMESIHVMMDTADGKRLRMRKPGVLLLRWALHDNCGLYSLNFTDGHTEYYMVDKEYIFSELTLRDMISMKLARDRGSGLALKVIEGLRKQLSAFEK